MKLFVISSEVPFGRANDPHVSAVHVVLYELLKEFVNLGTTITLQLIFNRYRREARIRADEEEQLTMLARMGVEIPPPVWPDHYGGAGKSLAVRLLRRVNGLSGGNLEDFYPTIRLGRQIARQISRSRADAVLTVWSPEGVAATHRTVDVPRVAYQGDIDFRPAEARSQHPALFDQDRKDGGGRLRHWRQARWLAKFRRHHLTLMRDVDAIANVTASNAAFYQMAGHSRSLYVHNTWSDLRGEGLRTATDRNRSAAGPLRIIGHVGAMDRTGSTFGLKFLLMDVLPILDRLMEGREYEVMLIGQGQPVPALRPLLRHPRVATRGFVEDLDAELCASDVFLLLNNAGPYRAAFTRHIMAWSLGLCMIVHANSILAIPEIVSHHNALVGSTGAEVAELIATAASDPDLNMRVRRGGRLTYERFFTPAALARELSGAIALAAGNPIP